MYRQVDSESDIHCFLNSGPAVSTTIRNIRVNEHLESQEFIEIEKDLGGG